MPDIEVEAIATKALAALQAANDSEPLLPRLLDLASRGMDVPAALTPYEVAQVCYALFTLLTAGG